MNIASCCAVAAVVSVVACTSPDAEDAELAESTTDSALTGQDEAALLVTLVDGTGGATAAATAQAVNAQAEVTLQPPGCATATTTGATTTVAFAGCTGPRGVVGINGSISLTITAVTTSSIAFTASSSGFEIGGGSLDLAVDGTYRDVAGAKSITVSSRTSGVGPRGHAISHEGDYTISWGTSCATVEGAWASVGDAGVRSIDVALTRCTTGCPRGAVSRTGVGGSTLDILFDGAAVATWTRSTRSGAIPLACTP